MADNATNKYLALTLKLARKGEGTAEPNPLVGAVIVKGSRIIGQGWHQYFGGPHAEINAINSVRNPADLKGATLYINLEPCTHFGKVPACAPAVIQSGIKKVIIIHPDPNPVVRGKGINLLKSAGLRVRLAAGLIVQEAKQMNKQFFKLQQQKLPYVIAKWAMSADGKIATRTGDSKWISSEPSRQLVQQLRTKVKAIMVGINTVLNDNPQLIPHSTPHNPQYYFPARVILDSTARTPLNSQIVRTARQIQTYIAVTDAAPQSRINALVRKGCTVIKTNGRSRVNLPDLFSTLATMYGINKILIEGGGEALAGAFKKRLIDEVYIFIAPKIIGGKDAHTPVAGAGINHVKDAIRLKNLTVRAIGPDILLHGVL